MDKTNLLNRINGKSEYIVVDNRNFDNNQPGYLNLLPDVLVENKMKIIQYTLVFIVLYIICKFFLSSNDSVYEGFEDSDKNSYEQSMFKKLSQDERQAYLSMSETDKEKYYNKYYNK